MTRHQPGRRVGFSPIRTTAGPRVLFTGRRPPVIGPAVFEGFYAQFAPQSGLRRKVSQPHPISFASQSASPIASPQDLDQAVPVEHGVDRALGRNPDVAVQSADQELADLAGTPMGLVALGRDDQALDLPRRLVGVANQPARDRSEHRDRLACSARKSCSRSCAKCPTRDRPRSPLRRLVAEPRTAGDRPLPNTPSTASTPPPERGKVLPMCPVRSVTYVSGRIKRSR